MKELGMFSRENRKLEGNVLASYIGVKNFHIEKGFDSIGLQQSGLGPMIGSF